MDILERHIKELIDHFEGDANKIGGHCLAIMHGILTAAYDGDELRAAATIAKTGIAWAENIKSHNLN